MEFLWKSYGNPMEILWNNTVAPPDRPQITPASPPDHARIAPRPPLHHACNAPAGCPFSAGGEHNRNDWGAHGWLMKEIFSLIPLRNGTR
jgi:hypothetical protein